MMAIALVFGLLFWTGVAFGGSRQVFLQGTAGFCAPFRALTRQSGFYLPVFAGVAFLITIGCVAMEIRTILAMKSPVGVFMIPGGLLSIAGGLSLSAHLWLSTTPPDE